jgi:hypothetical protein
MMDDISFDFSDGTSVVLVKRRTQGGARGRLAYPVELYRRLGAPADAWR